MTFDMSNIDRFILIFYVYDLANQLHYSSIIIRYLTITLIRIQTRQIAMVSNNHINQCSNPTDRNDGKF